MKLPRAQRIEITRFALVVLGIALLGYGAWLHYPPLGYATAGATMLLTILIGMWRAR